MVDNMRPPRESFDEIHKGKVRRDAWKSFYYNFLDKGEAFSDVASVIGDAMSSDFHGYYALSRGDNADIRVSKGDILTHLSSFMESELKGNARGNSCDDFLFSLHMGFVRLKKDLPLRAQDKSVSDYLSALREPTEIYLKKDF